MSDNKFGIHEHGKEMVDLSAGAEPLANASAQCEQASLMISAAVLTMTLGNGKMCYGCLQQAMFCLRDAASELEAVAKNRRKV